MPEPKPKAPGPIEMEHFGFLEERTLGITSPPNAFPSKRSGKAMSRKQSSLKAKSAATRRDKKEANLGQKEARIEKEKTSELAHMGEKSVQSKKRG